MRILQVIQKKQLRGAEVFAAQLSQHLNDMGHELKMVALIDGEAVLPFDGGVEVLGANLSKAFRDINAWRRMATLIEAFKPDIVQANAGDTLKYVVASRMIYRWKASIVFRNANKISDFMDSSLKRLIYRSLLSRVEMVASVSAECRADFMRTFRFRSERVKTLPIGVELPLRISEGLARKNAFLHVGGFVPEKNHEGLVRLFNTFNHSSPGFELWLVGEGRLVPAIQQMAGSSAGSSSIKFLGVRTDVVQLMQQCRALLLPSLIEGLPGVILEAFSVGTPVVAYNVGGISEVVNDSTGWLVSKGDESAFISAMNEVAEGNEDAIEQKKSAAKQLLRNHYDNKHIARLFMDAYNELLGIKK